jgi:tRNA threonylcarbamoyladenosine biosynthesis protein TsaB
MNLLAFDSAQAACSAAVWRDGAIAARRFARMERGHAEALMPMIVAALAEAGTGFPALDAVAVTVGPGSYTGIRVGLAAAKGIALARGIPLIGVTTLEAIARAARSARPGAPVTVAIETKRADLYVQSFDADLRPLGPPAAIAPEAARVPDGALVAGDGAVRLKALLAARADVTFAPGDGIADAATVAAIAAERGASGPVAPLYLRPPDVTAPRPVA